MKDEDREQAERVFALLEPCLDEVMMEYSRDETLAIIAAAIEPEIERAEAPLKQRISELEYDGPEGYL